MLTAYWDEGLTRLVVTAAQDAAGDRVTERVVALAARLGLREDADPEADETRHPATPARYGSTPPRCCWTPPVRPGPSPDARWACHGARERSPPPSR
ncbi:hypothetical protein ACR6C2_44125 [Streptomyces sp. INA 01156]